MCVYSAPGVNDSATIFPLEAALQHFEVMPHSPHIEAKETIKENMWEMYFTDHGKYVIYERFAPIFNPY